MLLQHFPGLSLLEIDRLAMNEIELRKQTIEMMKIDDQERQVSIAFINRLVKSTEMKGDKEFYKYQQPSEVFDSKKAKLSVFGESATNEEKDKIAEMIRNEKLLNEIFEEGG
ncbi:hypothetical protein CKN61_12730 [Carnobacterium divergens]|uniref:hypothetical protein n=1 Tax=Carnobacterium divergens TaxID=2748 RepID=UPI0010746EA2|nr:hypothetical protein [Carnobacterium divergens]TFI86905.1 hypothetical protein CKN61_12730 [Carnobacterium divergens]